MLSAEFNPAKATPATFPLLTTGPPLLPLFIAASV